MEAEKAKPTVLEKGPYALLLVDDDPSFRASTRTRLRWFEKNANVTLLEASSGPEAMDRVTQCKVDCVLLDYKMPGGTGLEWLSKLRAVDEDLAVIMVTGEGNEEIAVESMKAGATDYLVKGAISLENLYRAIANAIAKLEMSRTIKAQQEGLLHAERQRVMIQSLGAACHHLGQPLTVIGTYLAMLKEKETSAEALEMIEGCIRAADGVREIMDRLRHVSEYRTEPYLPLAPGEVPRSDEWILKI